MSEPAFSPVYADFCASLGSRKEMTMVDENGQEQTFKRLILNQCQAEFEKEDKLNVDATLTDDERYDRALSEALATPLTARRWTRTIRELTFLTSPSTGPWPL